MKFKCKICGQQIDNPYICPYCGSGSDHIILIDEDEGLKEETAEEKLDEIYEDKTSYQTSSFEDDKKQVANENFSSAFTNEPEEVINEDLSESKFENKEDDESQEKNEQKIIDLEKKPSEIDYFLKIYGYLYLNNLELASKFKIYFDHYLLEKSLEVAKDFTEEDFRNFSSDDDFLNKIIKQFKL